MCKFLPSNCDSLHCFPDTYRMLRATRQSHRFLRRKCIPLIVVISSFCVFILWIFLPSTGILISTRQSTSKADAVMTSLKWNGDNCSQTMTTFVTQRNIAYIAYCNGLLRQYEDGVIVIRNLLLNPAKSSKSTNHGGEALQNVLGQNESDELMTLQKGYFQLKCDQPPILINSRRGFINKSLTALQFADISSYGKFLKFKKFVFMVERIEYSNLYHTMTEWYSLFITMSHTELRNMSVRIMFMDKHPTSKLDTVWKHLFGPIGYADHLATRTLFRNAVWMPSGYDSLLNKHSLPVLPYLEEFRRFILQTYGLCHNQKVSCENITITFIWRRDYISHARNKHGMIQRKFANEDQLLSEMREDFPMFSVQAVQLENMSFEDQLKVILTTGILIGMHGAGLTHSLFLPQNAGLLEIFPKYINVGNAHFRAISKWRKLHYLSWRNFQDYNELPDFYTYVSPTVVKSYIRSIHRKMCR